MSFPFGGSASSVAEPAPVALPPALASGVVQLPPPPQQPPTARDVVRAATYAHAVEKAYIAKMRGANVSEVELAEAYRYQFNIVQQYEDTGAAPPWFEAALASAVAPLNRRVEMLEARMAEMAAKCAKLEAWQIIQYNKEQDDGHIPHTEFKVVPFPDGTWPTQYPHKLPPLKTIENIVDLTEDEMDRYIRGYYPDRDPASGGKRDALREAVGCTSPP